MNRTRVDAPPSAIFAVLCDGAGYDRWVVGTRRVRSVGAGWPAVGTVLHYTVGYGPIKLEDTTTVRALEPERYLELEARAAAVGTAVIRFRLEPDDDGGTRLSMEEHPARGPARWLHNPVLDRVIRRRNDETLRRLRRLAESRAGP